MGKIQNEQRKLEDNLRYFYVMCRISVYSGISGNLFNYENVVFNVEQEKGSIICLRMGCKNSSLTTTICHYLASPRMPNGDPWDGFFYLPSHS